MSKLGKILGKYSVSVDYRDGVSAIDLVLYRAEKEVNEYFIDMINSCKEHYEGNSFENQSNFPYILKKEIKSKIKEIKINE